MIRAIIFDCFGVIRVDATNIAYKKLGGNLDKDNEWLRDLIQQVNSGIMPNAAKQVAGRLGVTEEKWRETVQNSSLIDEEILEYIATLRPKYKTALLSNIGPGGLRRWFEPEYLEKFFDVIVGSGDIGFAKPEAEAYEITADRLGKRLDECVMIDDRLEFCEGATHVGMKAIQYETLGQLKKELKVILDSSSSND